MEKQIGQPSSSQKSPLTNGGDTELPGLFLARTDDPLFVAASMGELRTKGIAPKDDDEQARYITLEAIESFINDDKFNAEVGVIQNVLNFTSWVDETGWQYIAPVLFAVQEFSVSISVQAPSGSITFSMSALALDENHASVLAAMHKELSANVASCFSKAGNKTIAPNDAQKRKIEPSPKQEKTTTVEFFELQIKEHNGELKAYLMPEEGQWKQFGVRLFENVARKWGIDIPDEEGLYALEGSMELTVKDGRPNIQSITI